MEEIQYVLGPVTSLMVWRAVSAGLMEMPFREGRQPDLSRSCGRYEGVRALEMVRDLSITSMDVIVGDARQVHRCKSMRAIVLKEGMPSGSFCPTVEGTYVCSPELCFFLLGRGGYRTHLTEIACELCGTYVVLPDGSGAFKNCPALTTRSELDGFVRQMGRRHGGRAARQALAEAADGSDSPRETSLYLALSLPETRGGYAITGQRLNARVWLPNSSLAHAGKGYIVGDEVFFCDGPSGSRASLVVECDSSRHHFHATDSQGNRTVDVVKVMADDERRESCRERGIDVITFRREDFRLFDRFEAKARRVAVSSGQPFRESHGALRLRRIDLLDELFDTSRWGREGDLLRTMAGYERMIRHPRRTAVARRSAA